MKSLIFTNADSSVKVEYVVDLINPSANNFSVLAIKDLSDSEVTLGLQFKHIDYDKQTFIAKAKELGLSLLMTDTNVSSPVQLASALTVIAPAAASTTADTTPTFSGTGTPGGLVSIKIAATTVTTTVNAAGAWTVDFSILSSGAESALVTLTKGGVAATPVTRAFTIS